MTSTLAWAINQSSETFVAFSESRLLKKSVRVMAPCRATRFLTCSLEYLRKRSNFCLNPRGIARRMNGQNSGNLRETSKRVTRNAASWIVSTQKWAFPVVYVQLASPPIQYQV